MRNWCISISNDQEKNLTIEQDIKMETQMALPNQFSSVNLMPILIFRKRPFFLLDIRKKWIYINMPTKELTYIHFRVQFHTSIRTTHTFFTKDTVLEIHSMVDSRVFKLAESQSRKLAVFLTESWKPAVYNMWVAESQKKSRMIRLFFSFPRN